MTGKWNKYKTAYVVFACCVILSLVYILFAHREFEEVQFAFDDQSVELWSDGWEINYDGLIESNITLPVSVPVKRGNSVIIRKKLPDKLKNYNCIMISGKRQDIVVSVDGIQRAIFTDEGHRPFGKTSPSGIMLVPLYNTDRQGDIAIRFTSDSAFAGDIERIYIGNEKSLILRMLKANVIWIILDAVTFILGIVCAISYFTYGNTFRINRAMAHLSLFAIFSAIWSFAQSGIRQIFIGNVTTLESIGYSCYMIAPIMVLLYLNWVTDRKYERIVFVGIGISVCNFVLENALQVLFKISFFDMRLVTQAVFLIIILIVLMLCIKEIRIKFDTLSKTMLVGVIGLVLTIVQSFMIHEEKFNWGTHNRYIAGAFVFLLSGYIYTSSCVKKEQNLRKDAESRNLAKSLFLATMSHEIKTPINVVVGMNEMIMRDSNEDTILEYSSKIDIAGRTLIAIVNDVLDFSKIESGKMDIVCVDYKLKTMLSDLIFMTEIRIKDKDIKLILDIDESIPSGYFGDEIRIKQIIANLLTNATKYTKSGSITFTVKNLGIKDDEIDLYFSVKDTGIGIKTEDISRFMDSFVRLEQVRNSNIEGTGLGLTITTQLLNLMNSKLEVESVYGEGSDFHFVLHQKITDLSKMGKLKNSVEKKVKKRKVTFTAPEAKILVVDDSRTNIMVVCGLLKPTKMQIDTCESGEECLELCRDNRYDLIFMDHMMPDMDGIETYKRLKSDDCYKSKDSTVVVLTANTVSGSSETYQEVGFKYYLKKPIDVNELNEVIQKYLPKEMIYPLEDI